MYRYKTVRKLLLSTKNKQQKGQQQNKTKNNKINTKIREKTPQNPMISTTVFGKILNAFMFLFQVGH